MSAFYYVQKHGGEESWFPIQASRRTEYEAKEHPAFITVLSVSKIVEELSHEEKMDLQYAGPMYFDWDSKEETNIIVKVNQFLDNLQALGVDLTMCELFATGGKGYHLEVPQAVFMDKVPPKGVKGLPAIYKEVALKLFVDTLDLRIYSAQRGRMWRTVNVLRANGRYKVPITVDDMRAMTPDLCHELTSVPRGAVKITKPEYTMDLAVAYEAAAQKVESLLKKRKAFKPDPKAREKAQGPSVQWMMAGLGIKESAGFHEIAIQLSIAATTAGLSEEAFVAECSGLINTHESDGDRYNTAPKRAEELARMHRYMDGNYCYEFSIGALKSLMNHSAPDLDGLIVTKAEVLEEIKLAEDEEEIDVDEYADVAKGISLSKYGIYTDTNEGKKRICALSFTNAAILKSSSSGQIIGYECDVLVNGQPAGSQTLELEVFSGLTAFNRFASKYGHAFQGLDPQVRTVMMRFVENAKKRGTTRYVVTREGLDIVSVPHHENPAFHKPFFVWADGYNVVLQPDIKAAGLEVTFAGYPDPRGVFKTDVSKAPALAEWIEEHGNRDLMRDMLRNLFHCQKPDFLGKIVGWHVACFWKQIFNKVYLKFPILHINGAAGLGKCLGKDTPVLMADGSVRMVQDVAAGEQLLGPDGGVRNVIATCSGREMLYRVTPVKGDPYVVNESHILSLKKSGKRGKIHLADGRSFDSDEEGPINVNVKTFLDSGPNTLKNLKGWRSDALEFNRSKATLELDPYWLGLWLGDGKQCEPVICKPEGPVVDWWIAHAKEFGYSVSRYHYREGECPSWYVTKSGNGSKSNRFTERLHHYDLLNNKHIPDEYKFASVGDRLRLLAGLIDTDGHLCDSNFEFVSKYENLAKDFAFVCRSVGLACYVKSVRKGIKSTGFVGTYWRCVVSGDTDKIPTLAKKAAPRQQIKRVTVTGISVEPIGVGDYFGFTLDGDKLFLLGDFTVTHNTETVLNIGNLFYYEKEVRPLSPGSTPFAMIQHLCASASIPLVLDEYKPHAMKGDMHEKLKGMIRDTYNQRDVARGGGSRESDDYRILHESQMSGPLVFIAEAAEDEAAVMERVVLATITRPSAAVGLQWLARYQAYHRQQHLLGILGQYIAASIVNETTLESFEAEFDTLYDQKRQQYMLNAEDLQGGVDPETLKDKQNAKERSVYNHAVAVFGFIQFRKLVNATVGDELDGVMADMQEGIFARMSDLHAATTPEYVKVLSSFSMLSYSMEASDNNALIQNKDYAFVSRGDRNHIEIALRQSYIKYRVHCKSAGLTPLYANDISFMHAVRDSSAFVRQGSGEILAMPQVFTFDSDELARLGVDIFKSKQ